MVAILAGSYGGGHRCGGGGTTYLFPPQKHKIPSLGPEFFTPREGRGEIGGGGRGTHDGFPHKGDRGILVSPPEFLFLIDGRPGGESGKGKNLV